MQCLEDGFTLSAVPAEATNGAQWRQVASRSLPCCWEVMSPTGFLLQPAMRSVLTWLILPFSLHRDPKEADRCVGRWRGDQGSHSGLQTGTGVLQEPATYSEQARGPQLRDARSTQNRLCFPSDRTWSQTLSC